jgi:hypothetical protein
MYPTPSIFRLHLNSTPDRITENPRAWANESTTANLGVVVLQMLKP